ncbi:MAG: hypothetical protein KME64_16770 [Scytonematopsis contorta HA4267-MV1]|jgi:hypothetical protein|nr:hypothetical protein [Scytonematopsis contorta HA4267-MV1]
MSSKLWCIGASILGFLLPNSFGLSAKAVEAKTFSSQFGSRPSATSRIMVVQTYECNSCTTTEETFYHLESVGDSNKMQGYKALEGKDYELAYKLFRAAVDNYQSSLKVRVNEYGLEQARNNVMGKISEAQQNLQELEILRRTYR